MSKNTRSLHACDGKRERRQCVRNGKMNEFEARDYILRKGKELKTPEELSALIEEVKSGFNYDYGVVARSIGAVSAVVASYLARDMGITNFQASFAMWEFIMAFMYSNNKCGMSLTNYDDMLYPQYEYRFDKVIGAEKWYALQREAKALLEKDEGQALPAHPDVREHWQSIADGKIPFGYRVDAENKKEDAHA